MSAGDGSADDAAADDAGPATVPGQGGSTAIGAADALPAHVLRMSRADSCHFVDEWYDMADARHFWMRWRQTVLDRMLARLGFRDRSDVRALDVGGGSGVVRAEVERSFPFAVDCADLNVRALAATSPGRGRTMFYDVGDRHPDLAGRYDLILLLDVLEHIEPTAPFVRAVIDHLAPDGVLVVNVPALQWAMSRYDEVVGHHRRYSRRTLRAEFEPQGLHTLDARYWGMSLVPVLVARAAMLRFVPRRRVVDTGFRPPARWSNSLLVQWMMAETALLAAPPVGSSVLAAFSPTPSHSRGK